jgi:hypothetical protein
MAVRPMALPEETPRAQQTQTYHPFYSASDRKRMAVELFFSVKGLPDANWIADLDNYRVQHDDRRLPDEYHTKALQSL